MPLYFTVKVGRDFGAGQGGWSPDLKLALQFARAADATSFAASYLKEVAPWCKAIPMPEQI